VLKEPPPDVLPWEFNSNNVNIRVRWWMKSQRTYEVRTRAAVVIAIKTAAEEAGIDIPADTTISFADTPLFVTQESQAPSKMKSTRGKPKSQATDAELSKPADKRQDPEAEVPRKGELNEGADTVPR
jgi:small-conductance mechanosensitive channel